MKENGYETLVKW